MLARAVLSELVAALAVSGEPIAPGVSQGIPLGEPTAPGVSQVILFFDAISPGVTQGILLAVHHQTL